MKKVKPKKTNAQLARELAKAKREIKAMQAELVEVTTSKEYARGILDRIGQISEVAATKVRQPMVSGIGPGGLGLIPYKEWELLDDMVKAALEAEQGKTRTARLLAKAEGEGANRARAGIRALVSVARTIADTTDGAVARRVLLDACAGAEESIRASEKPRDNL